MTRYLSSIPFVIIETSHKGQNGYCVEVAVEDLPMAEEILVGVQCVSLAMCKIDRGYS
jgi:hypothetical protein